MANTLIETFRKFEVPAAVLSCASFGSGHIHDTYLVRTPGNEGFILQKVNNKIFRDVPAMMENIDRVTRHLRLKLADIPGSQPDKETLTIIPAKGGLLYFLDADSAYWRVFRFIEPHQSFDLADDAGKVREAGKAYGRFMYLLSDLPGKPLHDTIPNFHNIEMRLGTFHDALKNGIKERIKETPEEIKLVLDQAEEMTILSRLTRENKIPTRITHNDTKINNVLFSPSGKAMCVIDLDTVMPGLVHFDFGDAMRTFTNTAAEDEKDISKISMNIEYFRSFAEGYMESTAIMLTPTEKEYLAFSARYFTYLHVLRFLTDYLQGDVYYKIHYPGHNLVRAKNQFVLLKSMEKQYGKMQEIINLLS
jgi:hypothetical protein